MLKPKISIITVVRNAKIELERTIESVIKQKYDNIEYIIVDGASDDGTREVIESNSLYISQWISEKDSGIYDAMNKGIKMATGDYLWFLNAGDLIYSDDTLQNIFYGEEILGDIYYGDTLMLSEDLKVKGLRGKKPPRKLSIRSFSRGMSICHQSILIKRKIAPFYDLNYRYVADIDWVMESIRRSTKIVNCKIIISRFVEGGISTAYRKKSLLERYKVMVKYYGKRATIFYHILIAFNIFKPKYRAVKGQ